MKIEDVRSIAKSNGVSPGKLRKRDLIRSIQVSEGNFDCFATACNAECDQPRCLWRDDCFNAAKQGELS
ncbi:MAG TPA: Rho termination factor N-terminal domain-containing protein [Azonexus sp.]|nr:Rho termination factor N-terminal domain-containing protein [Azonexus sp.]